MKKLKGIFVKRMFIFLVLFLNIIPVLRALEHTVGCGNCAHCITRRNMQHASAQTISTSNVQYPQVDFAPQRPSIRPDLLQAFSAMKYTKIIETARDKLYKGSMSRQEYNQITARAKDRYINPFINTVYIKTLPSGRKKYKNTKINPTPEQYNSLMAELTQDRS